MKHRGEFPDLSREEFCRQIRTICVAPIDNRCAVKLFDHYRELQRWQPGVALIGSGTTEDVLDRHYGESLLALSLLAAGDRIVVDIGSGAGFPGLVLAAARPQLNVTLVESRLRKWVFLREVARKAGLSCRCLNARVAMPLPEDLPPRIDVITLRALVLPRNVLEALARMSPTARILAWVGRKAEPFPTAGWTRKRELEIPGARYRKIVEFVQK